MKTAVTPGGHVPGGPAQQRRSYGGLTSHTGLAVPRQLPGKHRSAPNTPRHSQADLTRSGNNKPENQKEND